MDKSSFQAQMAGNIIASEIRKNGQNVLARMAHLKEVFHRDDFTMPELSEVLAPGWLSEEQIEAKRLADEEVAKAEALAKAEAKANRKAA
jgi:hypothetical protein